MKTRIFLTALIISLVTFWAGCANSVPSTTGQDGGQSTDGTDGTDGTQDDGTSDNALTEEQQKQVDDVAEKQVTMMESLGSVSSMATPQTVPVDGGSVTTSTCPAIGIAASAQEVSLELDFGDGCNHDQYGALTMSGAASVELDYGASTVNVTFDDLAVDEQGISGTITGTLVETGAQKTTIQGDLDIEDGDTPDTQSAIVGGVTVTYEVETNLILVPTAEMAFTMDDGTTYQATAADIVSDPVGNGNFIPQAGTVSFPVDTGTVVGTTTITITFTDDSPVNGTVMVSVGGSEPVEYQFADLGT